MAGWMCDDSEECCCLHDRSKGVVDGLLVLSHSLLAVGAGSSDRVKDVPNVSE